MEKYTENEIDQICSLTISRLQECTLGVLRKIAKDVDIEGYSTMSKEELCRNIKMHISLAASEKLLGKCEQQIQALELLYDPMLHGRNLGKLLGIL